MNKEIKEKWVAALRSGRYKQGEEYLHHIHTDTFCCLGVLCELYDQGRFVECHTSDSYEHIPPAEVIEWAGLQASHETYEQVWDSKTLIQLSEENDEVARLVYYNDTGRSFKWIASYIERYL